MPFGPRLKAIQNLKVQNRLWLTGCRVEELKGKAGRVSGRDRTPGIKFFQSS